MKALEDSLTDKPKNSSLISFQEPDPDDSSSILTEHERMERIADVMRSMDWVELRSDLSLEENYLSLDILQGLYDEPLEYILSSEDEGECFLITADNPEGVKVRPSLVQFYLDLYTPASYAGEEMTVLTSVFASQSRATQAYQAYSIAGVDDVLFFTESISQEASYIFEGTFKSFTRKNGSLYYDTKLKNQLTMNALCVDIDGLSWYDEFGDDGDKRPVEAESVRHVFEFLPEELMPSYLTVTGNGIHLWYVFEDPLRTFSQRSLRRRKVEALKNSLYDYFDLFFFDWDVEADDKCRSTDQPFRAPGTLTKEGNLVRCFCPKNRVFRRSPLKPSVLSEYLVRDGDLVITEEEEAPKTDLEAAAERNAWIEQVRSKPATEKQLIFLQNLDDRGLLLKEESDSISSLTSHEAGQLIDRALSRRNDYFSKESFGRDSSQWIVKPHRLYSGKTGGVYNTILKRMTDVPVGRRYNSMHMLCGVAYMMTNPPRTRDEVEQDLLALLNTSWARKGGALTVKDVENALRGYNPDNWRTVKSVVETMGFSPFSDVKQKRNMRRRDEHLAYVAETKRKRCIGKIKTYREENPGCRKADVIRGTGLSKATVYKYWEETN